MSLYGLLNPFSDRRTQVAGRDDWGLAAPVAVVGAVVLANLVASVYSTQWLAGALPNPALVYLVSGVTAAVVPTFVWGGVSLLVHVGSVFAGAEGRFRQTVWIVGVGMVPYLLASLVTLVASVVAIAETAPPETVEQVARQSRVLDSRTVVQVANYLHVGFLLWCGLDWVDMTAAAWEIPRRRSAAVVSVPLALVIGVYTLLNLA